MANGSAPQADPRGLHVYGTLVGFLPVCMMIDLYMKTYTDQVLLCVKGKKGGKRSCLHCMVQLP